MFSRRHRWHGCTCPPGRLHQGIHHSRQRGLAGHLGLWRHALAWTDCGCHHQAPDGQPLPAQRLTRSGYSGDDGGEGQARALPAGAKTCGDSLCDGDLGTPRKWGWGAAHNFGSRSHSTCPETWPCCNCRSLSAKMAGLAGRSSAAWSGNSAIGCEVWAARQVAQETATLLMLWYAEVGCTCIGLSLEPIALTWMQRQALHWLRYLVIRFASATWSGAVLWPWQ